MSNYAPWDKYHNKIVSSKGGWKIGEGVFNSGYDMMNDLVGHYSYMQVIVLNATGKMVSREFADWIEAVHMCLSWPDPRIWCNRLGALSASAGTSSIAATCFGILSSDSRAFGVKPVLEGTEFIQFAHQSVKNGLSVSEFVQQELKKRGGKPTFMGYARPIAKGDERIPALERVAKDRGFKPGPHLRLAYEIEQHLHEQYDETMNINGYACAFLSDEGMTPLDVYRIFTIAVNSGVTACYVDAADRIPGSFSPLKCEDVNYTGAAIRTID